MHPEFQDSPRAAEIGTLLADAKGEASNNEIWLRASKLGQALSAAHRERLNEIIYATLKAKRASKGI